jgi:hypothetical protein
MDSGMVSKIQKSKRYAQEPDRVTIERLEVTFRGDHDTYRVTYVDGAWTCGCLFYRQRGFCSHTMALERILQPMIPEASVAETDAEQS